MNMPILEWFSDEENYPRIISFPDFPIYKEVMRCVGRYMAQVNCRHERYEVMPYPQRLGELSDLLKKHVLREEGNIELYLKLEDAIDNLPFIDGHPARQKSAFDIAVIKMTQWLQESIKDIRPVKTVSHKDKVVISVAAWGSYVEKMLSYTWKSLMAEENLPLLTKNKHVTFYIQTDEKSQNEIEKADITWKIKALGINIQYILMPDDLVALITNDNVTYWILGAATALGLEYAKKSEAAFHHSYPDMIYSDKFFSELLRLAQRNRCILAPGHRSDESLLLPKMAEYTKEDVISIPAADLVAHHMNCIHVNAWSCVVNNRPKNWFYPEKHVLIWEGHDLVYFNCPHGNALWFSYDVIKDMPTRFLMTIDSELDFICKGSDFYIPQENDSLYMCEFSNQARSPVNDLWCKFEKYAQYMYSVITHRDSFKFFARGMKMPINRKIRPLSMCNFLFDEQIAVERAVLNNIVVGSDMYEGVILSRPRWIDGMIFRM
jgi:hypothetical protein